jgi:hypothetical protein
MARTNNPIPYTGLFATPANQTELMEWISAHSGSERRVAMTAACMAFNLAYTLVEETYDTTVAPVPNAVDEARAASAAR